jgi:hypothetical protein
VGADSIITPREYIFGLGFVYHLTPESNSENILKVGLQPKRIQVLKNERYEFEEIICLSIPAFRTKWLQQLQDRHPEQNITILRIECRDLSLHKCSLDYSSTETQILINILKSVDFSSIVERSGDFAYLDLIHPNSISIDEIIKCSQSLRRNLHDHNAPPP